MTNRRSFVLGLFITASLLCTSRTAWGNSEINTYTKTDFAMDTVVSETLYTTGEDITADIISALKDVEENWISWTKESSQIYQINQNAGNTTTVSDETATLFKTGTGFVESFWRSHGSYYGKSDPPVGH